jgi:hypothetical protein
MSHVDQKKRERLTAGLVKKTLNKEIRWKETRNGSGFAVDFERSSIELHRGVIDNDFQATVIYLIDSKGDIVDTYSVGDALKDKDAERGLDNLPYSVPDDPGETFIRLVESQVSGVDNVYDDVFKALAV